MNYTYTYNQSDYLLIDAPDGLLDRIDRVRMIDEVGQRITFLCTDGTLVEVAYQPTRAGFRQGMRRSLRH